MKKNLEKKKKTMLPHLECKIFKFNNSGMPQENTANPCPTVCSILHAEVSDILVGLSFT
jgi:hypothetical protein